MQTYEERHQGRVQAEQQRLAVIMFTDIVGLVIRWVPMKPTCCAYWKCTVQSSSSLFLSLLRRPSERYLSLNASCVMRKAAFSLSSGERSKNVVLRMNLSNRSFPFFLALCLPRYIEKTRHQLSAARRGEVTSPRPFRYGRVIVPSNSPVKEPNPWG